ncbi:biotin-dependent carboxyltransferase family protein [Leuconostoc miyukkimchii]|uniref:5-oxoprolinase subunit C family protein n=1 Tax=Leuconostoc miyukkimchii TaxID=910540 RepID=UPI001C7CF34A|nr:hypothetical protein [Leuconostoc miyukkimchii]
MKEPQITINSAKLSNIQDSGRYGFEQFGISANGAIDMYAYLKANELVGNKTSQPTIEVTAFGLSLTSNVDIPIAITGGEADLKIDNQTIKSWQTVILPAKKELTIGMIKKGLRVYVAFAGGIHAKTTLNSTSRDTILDLGTQLTDGMILPLNGSTEATDMKITQLEDRPTYGSPWHIRVCDGPDTNIFTESTAQFYKNKYRVSPVSNHVGIRLKGPAVENFKTPEILSRGVGVGSIEIFPTGQAVVLHRGRTVTAGYPIIGVVSLIDLDMIGQARPGDEIHFEHISIDEARELYKQHFNKLPYRR